MTRTLHRLLRRILPPRFRATFGADMEDVFVEALERARRVGRGAALALWMREIVDVVSTGYRMRSEVRRFGAEFVARGVARRWVGRKGGVMMGISDDLRYALRSLTRRPSLTAFAAVTIGLGVGATTAIFSTLEAVVINPLPYEHGDRMVSLFQRIGSADAFVPPSAANVEAWAEMTDVLEEVEVWSMRGMTLTGRGEAREVLAGLIRPTLHDFLGREPVIGRRFSEDELVGEGARVTLIGYGMWDELFGRDPAVLGETLQLDGEPFTIVGVMPKRTLMPGFGLMQADVWRPLDAETARRGSFATGVLAEGVTVENLNARLADVPVVEDAGTRADFVGVARLVGEDVSNGMVDALRLLMGAVVLLLLIACVNVSNLLLFRANARRRETAVRAALGGGHGRLVRQLLLESLVLALLGGGLGILLAYVGQDAILQMRPARLNVLEYVGINGRVLAFALGITVLTGFVFGLVPAMQIRRDDALDPLRSGMRTEGDVLGGRARWVLVAGEVALSFALLLGSLTVLSTLSAKQSADPGYRADEVAVMSVILPSWKYESAEERGAVFQELRTRADRLPGVVHISVSSGIPPHAGILFGSFTPEGGEPLDGTQVLHGPSIDADYFATIGQRIVAGRGFTEADLEGEEDLMVFGEETARLFFPEGDPVGKRFRPSDGDEWTTVIGVVEDVAMTGLASTTKPLQAYHPQRRASNQAALLVRVPTGADPSDVLPLMREIVRSLDADIRIDRLTVATDMMRATLDRERFTTSIMATFAGLALLLAAVGLYGVVSQVVGQRTREIGIRIALGARKTAIAGMVFKRAGSATFVGVVLGVVLAVGTRRVLASAFAGMEPTSMVTYVLAALGLTLTTLLAAYAPARRASRVDPVDAMRVE